MGAVACSMHCLMESALQLRGLQRKEFEAMATAELKKVLGPEDSRKALRRDATLAAAPGVPFCSCLAGFCLELCRFIWHVLSTIGQLFWQSESSVSTRASVCCCV